MEEALQPLETEQQTKSRNYLALGIAASVVLHLLCTAVLFGLPGGSPPRQSVTYIDLRMLQHPAPMTPPTEETIPEKVAAKPATPPVPETSPVPAPLQNQQPQTVQDQPQAPPETKAEEQLSHTTLGLGLTKGYFKGLGDGETLREGVKGYYQEMLQRINEKWWQDPQLGKQGVRPVVFTITVARTGEIVDTQIMRSSGNRSYDRAVLALVKGASPLPPLPESYVGDFFQAPVRVVPPLNLLAW